jgi:F0F1-type ATP synthase assembly protein I
MVDRPTGETPDRPADRRDGDAARTEALQWHRMAGMGLEFVVAILLFAGLGWWLDGVMNTKPWLLIVGCGLGFAVGLGILFRAAKSSFR